MAKCSKCGKSGIFFKVNTQGKCKECERVEKLLAEENEIKSQIELLNTKRAETEKSYESIKKPDQRDIQDERHRLMRLGARHKARR